ncbi:DsbA family protein [Candidatus Woesearchaeota archaeon]|nr:DsbA family protein [Candidatus Woesearchaeota archaeon]
MICFIAMILFAILGIFSATHRRLAKEAFDCVFRKLTLRKCQTGLDSRLKAQITGLFFKVNPRIGKFTFKHFEDISTIFTIIFVASIIGIAWGGYNWWIYGNCNGPNQEGFCLFDPTGKNTGMSQTENPENCVIPELRDANLKLDDVDQAYFLHFKEDRPNQIVFLGCYACPYTRNAYPTIKKLLERDDVEYDFVHFPVKEHSPILSPILNCLYEQDKDKIQEFNDVIFSIDTEEIKKDEVIIAVLDQIGASKNDILACASSNSTIEFSNKQLEEAKKTGIYGTPLVFVNGEPVVGPKPLRVYKRLLK